MNERMSEHKSTMDKNVNDSADCNRGKGPKVTKVRKHVPGTGEAAQRTVMVQHLLGICIGTTAGAADPKHRAISNRVLPKYQAVASAQYSREPPPPSKSSTREINLIFAKRGICGHSIKLL